MHAKQQQPLVPPVVCGTRYLQVILAGIAALILTVGFSRFAYTPLLPLMLAQTELTKAQGSWLATFNYLGYLSGALLVTGIARPQLKFRLYRLCLLLALASTLGMGLTEQYWLWAALRFAGGVSSVAGLLLASAFVLRWLAEQGYTAKLGLHFIGIGAGIALPGLLIGVASAWLQWDGFWQWLAMGGLLFAVPAWYWMPRPTALTVGNINAVGRQQDADRPWLRSMLLAYFCAGFAFVVSTTFVVVELESLPQFQHQGGWIWLAVGLVCAPAAVCWDLLAAKTGLIMATVLAYVLHLCACALPLLSAEPGWHLLGALLFGASFIGIVSLMLTLAGQRFAQNASAAMGKLTLSYGLAQILAPLFAGFLVQWTGNFRIMLLLSCLMLLIGLLVMVGLGWRQGASVAARE